jgi:hypothetical protein
MIAFSAQKIVILIHFFGTKSQYFKPRKPFFGGIFKKILSSIPGHHARNEPVPVPRGEHASGEHVRRHRPRQLVQGQLGRHDDDHHQQESIL